MLCILRTYVALFAAGILIGLGACQGADAGPLKDESRLALVVGNASYPAGRLASADNDAGLVAQSLAQIGFAVTAAKDVDAATLRKTVSVFVDKVRAAGPGALVFVYIAGYGLQYDGENFLVPVDARIEHQVDVPTEAVPLAGLQTAIEALPGKAHVFVYDLARATPFAQLDVLPLASGLSLVRAGAGSLVAFNAAPGTVGQRDVPPYGLYARALAEGLRAPGLAIPSLFARVRLRVAAITSAGVIPWDDSDLSPGLVLLGVDDGPRPTTGSGDAGITSQPEETAFWTAIAADRLAAYQTFARTFPADGLGSLVKDIVSARLEAATWSEAVRLESPAAYWTYMQRYPRGPHYVDVRRRLAAIHAPLEPPSRFDVYDFADLPAPSADQVRSYDRFASSVEDSVGVPTPRPPDDLLPPAPAATDLELVPPPLVPVGVLPIPAPLPAVPGTDWLEMPARIEQPFVPGLGHVSIETGSPDDGAPMTLVTDAGPVTQTRVSADKSRRTLIETDAADEIVSRTTMTRAEGSFITITQTGPRGEALATYATRIDPLGERVTTIANGRNERVAEIRADRWGVLREMIRGTATLDATTFTLPALEDHPATPPKPAEDFPAPALAPVGPLGPPAMPPLEDAVEPKLGTALDASAQVKKPAATKQAAVPAPATSVSPTSVLAPSSRSQQKTEAPASAPSTVPLPVPRPPSNVLSPRRSAASGRLRH